ncbi:superoxide dismutase family protein [Christiangramia fulva]|uniref:Superoxide dismutase family protein n=1 Tax=Christiangramia fulva TaxID=2126553 RepID=A0A2R3Z778_9FLAO|nr:superoxide dismutase family protein [Christiangramia fulva]AVR46109.1 superoxide dismutase family protein [Christiangramia fulva]
MKKISLSLIFCAGLLFMGCKNENKENNGMEDQSDVEMSATDMTEGAGAEAEAEVKKATADLQAKSGSNLSGTVTFTQQNGEVTMKATVKGLKEGKHAIHIHEAGDCSADDGTSAGGHWNPTNEQHGKWGSSEGYHKGDIGNIEVGADGTGTITRTTDEWCIGCDDPNKNIVGKAIIVHQGVDDFTSQPSGAAGKRVGCGVIKKTE